MQVTKEGSSLVIGIQEKPVRILELLLQPIDERDAMFIGNIIPETDLPTLEVLKEFKDILGNEPVSVPSVIEVKLNKPDDTDAILNEIQFTTNAEKASVIIDNDETVKVS